MKKSIIYIILSALLTAVLLAGCSSDSIYDTSKQSVDASSEVMPDSAVNGNESMFLPEVMRPESYIEISEVSCTVEVKGPFSQEEIISWMKYIYTDAENRDETVAVVNGRKISLGDVLIKERTNEMQREAYERQLSAGVFEKFDNSVSAPVKLTRNEILNDLIVEEVSFLEAQKRGLDIIVNNEYSRQMFEEEFELLYEQDKTASILIILMEIKGMTKEEYMEAGFESQKKMLARAKLLEEISKTFTDKQNEDMRASFVEYIEGCKKNYDIVIYEMNL